MSGEVSRPSRARVRQERPGRTTRSLFAFDEEGMTPRPVFSQRYLRNGPLVEESYRLFGGWRDAASIDENFDEVLRDRFPTVAQVTEVRTTISGRLRNLDAMRPLIVLARNGMRLQRLARLLAPMDRRDRRALRIVCPRLAVPAVLRRALPGHRGQRARVRDQRLERPFAEAFSVPIWRCACGAGPRPHRGEAGHVGRRRADQDLRRELDERRRPALLRAADRGS